VKYSSRLPARLLTGDEKSSIASAITPLHSPGELRALLYHPPHLAPSNFITKSSAIRHWLCRFMLIYDNLLQAVILRLILDYSRSSEVNVAYAVGLSFALFVSENGRIWTFMLMIHLGFVLGPCSLILSSFALARSRTQKCSTSYYSNSCYLWTPMTTSCAGGRHDMPRPLQVDLWPFDLESGVRVTCDVAYSAPVLVFLGLSVLDLGPMYATDRRQTNRRQTRIIA